MTGLRYAEDVASLLADRVAIPEIRLMQALDLALLLPHPRRKPGSTVPLPERLTVGSRLAPGQRS